MPPAEIDATDTPRKAHGPGIVLVTGGAGFIGTHLVRRLRAAGHAVRVLDDLSTGRRKNVPGDVPLIEASILDRAALAEAAAGVHAVAHLAAVVSVPQSVDDPRTCWRTNVDGTHEVIEAARHGAGGRPPRIVLASSCAIYGDTPDEAHPARREDEPPDPRSPYAASKAAAEALCLGAARSLGATCACLRFFNVIGPGQRGDSGYAAVLAAFADAVRAGRPCRIDGDGGQTRDFVSVGDVARAIERALVDRALEAEVLNVATGRETSVRELAAMAARAAERPDEPGFGPERAGDLRRSVADVTRARERLGFVAADAVDDVVAEVVAATE